MTRAVAIPLLIALGIAITLAGTVCSSRAARVSARWRGRIPGTSSEERVQLIGALTAVFGIFVAVVAVIAEIWWMQGVKLP